MDTYELLLPVIQAAVFSANPAEINKKVTLTVTVEEQTVTREPEKWYAGEIYCGEV